MTKKSLIITAISGFFLINQAVFASSWDAPVQYTTGWDLPSVYDGYTLKNDSRMYFNSLADYGVPANSCDATITRTLMIGSHGDDVATLQDYLHDSGYLAAQSNGYYGKATSNAVKLFQSRYGIKVTGSVGPISRDTLNNLICGNDVAPVSASQVTYVPSNISSNVSSVVQIPSTSVNESVSYLQNGQVITIPVSQAKRTSDYTVSISKLPSVTIVIPLNKSSYNEGDTVPVTWVASNLNATHYTVMLANTQSGLEKRVASLSGDTKTYNVTLTKELLDSVCGGTMCAGTTNGYRMYVIAYYQTLDGELSIKAYADQISVTRPLSQVVSVSLTPSKNPVSVGEQIKLFTYIPSQPIFSQYQNLYWKITPVCPPGVSLTVNGLACGNDIYVYQSNINTMPDITVTINGNVWGPTEVTFNASVLSYYGGQELGRTQTKVLVNK